jgi:hypothetical protein
MSSLLAKACPSLTTQIRMDHTAVILAFHQYEIGASAREAEKVSSGSRCCVL